MTSLFGTDGVRGIANSYPITPEMAMRIGQAAGQVFKKRSKHVRPSVVIGKDTRLSGYMIESALQAGFTSAGFYCLLAGPMPTPAVAMLAGSLRADLGVMITASHNPFHDNGIKIFSPNGQKLCEPKMLEIEDLVLNPEKIELAPADKIGKAIRVEDAVGRYMEFCKNTVPKDLSLDNMRIVVDCANGAAYNIAPKIFWELGAQVIRVGAEPDGFNINRDCGAMHPERMAKAVAEHGADLGIALDGDGDRLILCDERGHILDGDHFIAAMATCMKESGQLVGNGVVTTVMSNMGLEKYLNNELGLELIRTKVGDHHVAQAMRDGGYNLGGEASGHLIMTDYAPTGDGTLAALQFLAAMSATGKSASELGNLYKPYPQRLNNIRLPESAKADDILAHAKVKERIAESETALQNMGRVLIRKSGTEPLIRVMVEANSEELVNTHTDAISKEIENHFEA